MRRQKEMNSSDRMMLELINFGGCLFTRFGLLKELQVRGFSASFVDFHVFGPGLAFEINLDQTFNAIPNEVPAWFWEAVEQSQKA